MGVSKKQGDDLSAHELDQLVLNEFPYPLAVRYRQLLDAATSQTRIREGLALFEFGLRTVTVSIINQYLNQDSDKLDDEKFNRFLMRSLPRASMGVWVQLFFMSLSVYKGRPELFFAPELYELYWDTSTEPHKQRSGIQRPFRRLVELRNDNAHWRLPANERNAREVLQNLRVALAHFAFIQNYDLIRITELLDDGQWRYQVYRGQKLTDDSGQLTLWRRGKDGPLHEDWFYLMRTGAKGREVLELHPFLITWLDTSERVLTSESGRGMALYDQLQKSKITYITFLRHEPVEYGVDSPLLVRLRSILHYEIEELRIRRRGKIELSWTELRSKAADLSRMNMESVGQKYSAELYLQREDTFRQFHKFLESDKNCFVLIGKSGVGKTNFVLSLADEYQATDRLCYLMYDGARLSVPDDMVEKVGQDLGDELRLVEELRRDFFKTVDDRGLMVDKQFLIIFDAINENVDGRRLLQSIDQMVGKAHPWLKVVITSRPQAWRTLKRGLHLATTRYFQQQDSDDLTVEMPEFSIKLEEFERGELEQAYEKYAIVYELKTPYNSLPFRIRETLRDPLVLRLVADIYRGETISERVQVSEIYRKYIDALLNTARLEPEDLYFLKREIVPRMISEGHYDNKLTDEQIARAKTSDGRPLWEMIRSKDTFSSGEQINARYVRLANAEILIDQGSPIDYEVSFKYERFYDYFGGERLRELAGQKRKEHLLDTYITWIRETLDKPFLWGSVQSALLYELKQEEKGSERLILELCQTDEQLVKEMMVATLTEWGRDESEGLEALLDTLLQLGNDELTFSQRRLNWRTVEPATEIINAKKIAVEVAGNLGSVQPLIEGNLDRSAHVRIHTIRQTLNLWHRDWQNHGNSHKNNRGFQTLRAVLAKARTGLLPNMHAVEAGGVMFFYIVLTTFAKIRRGEEAELGRELQKLVRKALDQLLYIGENGLSEAILRAPIREFVLNTIVRVATRTTTDSPESFVFNPTTANAFLQRDQSDKNVLLTVTRYYVSANDDVERLAESLPRVFELNEPLVDHALQFALLAQWKRNRKIVLEMSQFIVEEGMKRSPPAYVTYAPIGLLASLLLQGQRDDVIRRLYLEWETKVMRSAQGKVILSGDEYLRSEFATYFQVTYALQNRVDTELPIDLTEQAIRDGNLHFLSAIILDLKILASRKEFHRSILTVSNILLRCLDDPLILNRDPGQLIQKQIVNLLARLRRFATDDVDDFMAVHQMPSELQTRVKTVEVKEEIGGDFINPNLGAAIVEAMLNSEDLQPIGQWIVAQSVRCNSLDQWLNLAFRRLINLAYGEDIFKLKP